MILIDFPIKVMMKHFAYVTLKVTSSCEIPSCNPQKRSTVVLVTIALKSVVAWAGTKIVQEYSLHTIVQNWSNWILVEIRSVTGGLLLTPL